MRSKSTVGLKNTIFLKVIFNRLPICGNFPKYGYGNHLNPDWKKWTMEEAKAIFLQFNLTNNTWDLETLKCEILKMPAANNGQKCVRQTFNLKKLF